jgi:quaternary ammonium compound-resistance protein SugE
MYWTLLTVAALFEIVWAATIPWTAAYTRLWPSVINLAVALCSFGCLSQAIKGIPVGTAYAIWTGSGAVGVALIGIFFFGEPRDALRIFFIFTIAAGLVGLKVVSH